MQMSKKFDQCTMTFVREPLKEKVTGTFSLYISFRLQEVSPFLFAVSLVKTVYLFQIVYCFLSSLMFVSLSLFQKGRRFNMGNGGGPEITEEENLDKYKT